MRKSVMGKNVQNVKLLVVGWVLSAFLVGCSSAPKNAEDEGAFVDAPADSSTDVASSDSSTYPASAGSDVSQSNTAEKEDSKGLALIKTRTVYFDFDSSTIKSEFYPVLKAHAAHIKSGASGSVRLEGHADERGTREYNMALGERRAKAVSAYLRSHGVAAQQLESVSYGEEKPVDYGHNDQAWSKNRRVVIRY